MNPTDSVPTINPPVTGQPVVEFIRTQRQNAAYLFLGLSILCLVGTIFLAVRAFKAPASTEKSEETKKLDDEKPPLPELPKAEASNLNKSGYMVGWIGGLAAFLVTASVGVFLQAIPPKHTPDAQQREARVLLLAVGGLLGLLLILFGGAYFYLWSDSLTSWLDKGENKEMKWVVIPLLMVAGGAGLVFAAVQPARAEERNDSNIRRLVYGSTFAVTVLLLFVVLVIGNIVVSKHFPNQLDTTETGFYTLSNSTREFLGKLSEPATLYVVMPESGEREVNDIRQFAYTAQDAADGKLNVKFVSPVTNKTELARLKEKYPRMGDSLGLLLTAGEDEKRNIFIGFEDLFEMDPRSGRPKGFAGEGKVMKELRFLADNEQKPVIYFTQSNGELAITSTPGVESIGGGATQLKAFLEKAYLDVRPLVFPIKNPTVPDDAAVVIVAEPQTPLSAEAVGALRNYMNNPVKKGKLIVLAGAAPGPNDKGMAKTGLESLLAEFNVRLGEKFIYSLPTQQSPEYRSSVVGFTQGTASNPINQSIGQSGRMFRFPLPREVSPSQGNPTFKAEALLITYPGRYTWLEDDPVTNVEATLRDIIENDQIQARKNLSNSPRSVAVVVSEGGAPNPHGGPPAGGSARMLVVGNSLIFSDKAAGNAKSTPISFDMVAVAIDWLRDRPPLATTVEAKTYKEYQPPEPAGVSDFRLIYMPLGLAMLLVIGLGTGVWVMRRK